MLLKERDFTIEQKESEIQKLRRMLFGQKRERFEASPIQLPLDFGENLSEKDIKALEELISKKAKKVKQEEKKARDADRSGGINWLHVP